MERPSIKEALQGIKGAHWRKALQWLHAAPDAVVICNACANTCSKAQHWQMALTLTSQVLWKRLEATEVTCNTAIQAVVRGGAWQQAMELASNAWLQVRRDAVTWNSAADAVSRGTLGAKWQLSLELLSLRSWGLQPDIVTQSLRAAALKGGASSDVSCDLWAKALQFSGSSVLVTTNALGALNGGEWRQGLAMLRCCQVVDAQALSAASKLCEESWHWALHLLQEAERPDVIAISSAMSALSLALHWQRALLLFQQIPQRNRDVVSYGAAMAAAAVGKHWELALSWLSEMLQTNTAPNVITYNAAINACEGGLQWEHALSLLRLMATSKVIADVISYSSCIAACGQGQRWSDAMNLLSEMHQQQLQRNIIAMGSAVSVCEKSGRWELALEILNQSLKLKLEVNTVTYNAAISACEKCSQWNIALDLFNDMELVSISRSMISSAAVITACAQAVSWAHAIALLELQDTPHQPGARFASLAATLAACEAASTTAVTIPRVLNEVSETIEVLAIELLHNHEVLSSFAAARWQRQRWIPMLRRCQHWTSTGGDRGWRLYDAVLEQESFLSTVFTMDMLRCLQLDIPSHRSWLPLARHGTRRMDGNAAVAPLEPNAKSIAAWTAGQLNQLSSFGRVHEWSWKWKRGLLVPVFVEHDRSPHAERQALLTWLHQVQSLKGNVL